jgi:hypothetical protein
VYEWYGKGLREIARFCADRLGDPGLQRRLDEPAPPEALLPEAATRSEPQH